MKRVFAVALVVAMTTTAFAQNIQSTNVESMGEVITLTKNAKNEVLFQYCKPNTQRVSESTAVTLLSCQNLGQGYYSEEQVQEISSSLRKGAVMRGGGVALGTIAGLVVGGGASAVAVSAFAIAGTSTGTGLVIIGGILTTTTTIGTKIGRAIFKPGRMWSVANLLEKEGKTSLSLVEVAQIINEQLSSVAPATPVSASSISSVAP